MRTSSPRLTSVTRRGFNHILNALKEDSQVELSDPQHWAFRRLALKDRAGYRCAQQAVAWLQANAEKKEAAPMKEVADE